VGGAAKPREMSALQQRLVRAAGSAWRGRRRAATFLVVLAALGFGYNAIFGANGINMFEHKRAEDRDIQLQIHELTQENNQLRQNIQQLKTDPDAIEHEARQRLHYVRPGEIIWTESGPEGSQQPAGSGQQRNGQP
jgi:cell division protein FtsB